MIGETCVKTFAEMQSSLGDQAVNVVDDRALSGYLKLAGPETSVILAGDHPYYEKRDQNGWFDITVEMTNGRYILLHNSIETMSRMHGFNGRAETHIFPNVVIFGDEGDLGVVKSVSFQLDRLRYFFHYEHIERQSLWRAPTEVLSAIRGMRKFNNERYLGKTDGADNKHDFLNPAKCISGIEFSERLNSA